MWGYMLYIIVWQGLSWNHPFPLSKPDSCWKWIINNDNPDCWTSCPWSVPMQTRAVRSPSEGCWRTTWGTAVREPWWLVSTQGPAAPSEDLTRRSGNTRRTVSTRKKVGQIYRHYCQVGVSSWDVFSCCLLIVLSWWLPTNLNKLKHD